MTWTYSEAGPGVVADWNRRAGSGLLAWGRGEPYAARAAAQASLTLVMMRRLRRFTWGRQAWMVDLSRPACLRLGLADALRESAAATVTRRRPAPWLALDVAGLVIRWTSTRPCGDDMACVRGDARRWLGNTDDA